MPARPERESSSSESITEVYSATATHGQSNRFGNTVNGELQPFRCEGDAYYHRRVTSTGGSRGSGSRRVNPENTSMRNVTTNYNSSSATIGERNRTSGPTSGWPFEAETKHSKQSQRRSAVRSGGGGTVLANLDFGQRQVEECRVNNGTVTFKIAGEDEFSGTYEEAQRHLNGGGDSASRTTGPLSQGAASNQRSTAGDKSKKKWSFLSSCFGTEK